MHQSQSRHNEKSHQSKNKKSAPPMDDLSGYDSEIETEMKSDEMPPLEESADAAPKQASAQSENQSQSIGSMISQNLAKESQASIDNALKDASDKFQAVKKYTREQPAEAALIACTAGLATWVLLGTKPGRKVFDAAAERFVPELTSWASKTFKASL